LVFESGSSDLFPLQSENAEKIAQLHGACFDRSWSAESFRALLDDPFVAGAMTQQGSTMSGFILWRVVAGEAEILTIAVAPDRRQSGLGRSLLGGAMVHAIQQGAEEMFLEVAESNEGALALYRSFGFEQVARRDSYYEESGEDALVLRTGLSQS